MAEVCLAFILTRDTRTDLPCPKGNAFFVNRAGASQDRGFFLGPETVLRRHAPGVDP